jgi:hypothetical protein
MLIVVGQLLVFASLTSASPASGISCPLEAGLDFSLQLLPFIPIPFPCQILFIPGILRKSRKRVKKGLDSKPHLAIIGQYETGTYTSPSDGLDHVGFSAPPRAWD